MTEQTAEHVAVAECLRYPTKHTTGHLPDHCRGCGWERVRETVERAVNSAYGTDPRHGLLARAVADEVMLGKPIPWALADHFGSSSLPEQENTQ